MADLSAIPKLSILLICAFAHYVGLRAPNPRPTKHDTVYKGQPFEIIVRWLAYLSQATIVSFIFAHCATVVAPSFPAEVSAPLFSALCTAHATKDTISSLKSFNTTFSAGALLLISGAALRVWCYRALGDLFTYEVTIRPTHRLTRTGPYAIVRHPSYTGVLLLLIGSAMVCYGPESYVTSCGVWRTPLGGWVHFWYACAIFSVASLVKRGRVEDEKLQEIFGREWELYKEEVPQSFIPFVW